jgi:hypothetical protein
MRDEGKKVKCPSRNSLGAVLHSSLILHPSSLKKARPDRFLRPIGPGGKSGSDWFAGGEPPAVEHLPGGIGAAP